MRYPGGKGKTFQHIINLMPPHRVYIETHLGGGAVLRHKLPAQRTIAIDVDDRVVQERAEDLPPGIELLCTKAEDFLLGFDFQGDELVYVDPPYHPSTRRQPRVYRHDYSAIDHERLAKLLATLPCMVILSGYANPVYQELLAGWRTRTFEAKTHTDVRVETLWFNFDAPKVLHDSRHLGNDFRQRQTNKRRMERLQERVHRMEPAERAAFVQWLQDAYPPTQRSLSP